MRSKQMFYRKSYKKTILVFAMATVFSSCGVLLASLIPVTMIAIFLAVLCMVASLAFAVVVIGGFVVLDRDARIRDSRIDLFAELARGHTETAIGAHSACGIGYALSRAARTTLYGEPLVVGDVVEVLSLEEIQKTLDPQGCLEGLPFQEEMARYCSKTFRVFRNIDKILDYGNTKGMRRIRNVVTLIGLRCDGSAHDACEARCYLLWNRRWLRRVGSDAGVCSKVVPVAPSVSAPPALVPGRQYTCQFTALAAITTPIKPFTVSAYVLPVLSGSVSVGAFLVAVLTRLFNRVQQMRGGVDFPYIPPSDRIVTPTAEAGIKSGDRVSVRSVEEIAATLDQRRKNRGMGFTAEMTKYCGKEYVVDGLISRIIDDATKKMLVMKYPCLILKGVNASGETEKLCVQHELIYWREVWLKKLPLPPSNEPSLV